MVNCPDGFSFLKTENKRYPYNIDKRITLNRNKNFPNQPNSGKYLNPEMDIKTVSRK